MECIICKKDTSPKWPWSKTCQKKKCVAENLKRKNADNRRKKNLKRFGIKNDFSDKGFLFDDKVIKYKGSLTGKAYVGLAKEPLMKNEGGIGFQGVLLQSENRELVQCSECGEWMKQITPKHIKMHGMKVLEYKKKYGINKKTGLVSDVTKIKRRDKGIINLANQRANGQDTLIPDAPRGRSKESPGKRRQYQNLKGTCPKQLEERVVNFIHRFKRMPTAKTESFPYTTLQSRFGSTNKAYKNFGLPTVKGGGRGNVIYTFPDHTIFVIHQNDPLEHDIFYSLMVEKCPILK